MSFSILYSDAFLSEKTISHYESGSLLDAIKSKYPLINEKVSVSHKSEKGVFEIPDNMLKYIRPKNGEYIAFVRPEDRDTARMALTIALIATGQGYVSSLALGSSATIAAGVAVTVGSTYLASAIVPYESTSSKSDSTESSTSSISGSGNSINQGGTVPYLIGTHKFTPPKAIQPITEYVNKTDAYLTEVICLGSGPLIIDPDDIILNETKITDFDDVELQIKDNYTNTAPITLVTGVINSETVSATFSDTDDSAIRTTEANCERIDVEIGYPSLVRYDSDGKRQSTSCVYRLDYRETGTDQWIGFNGSIIEDSIVANSGATILRIKNGETNGGTQRYKNATANASYFTFTNGIPDYVTAGEYFTVYGSTYNSGSFYAYSIDGNNVYIGGYTIVSSENGSRETINQYGKVLQSESTAITYDSTATPINSTDTDATSVATYRTHTLTNIKKGQYDVRITRITAEPSANSNISNEFQWTQLKSTQLTDDNGDAIKAFPDRYCYVGIRVKATDQLSGAINNLSVTATSVTYAYDEATQSLTGDLSSGNNAWEYLKVLTGDDNKRPIDLDEIDIDAFIEWAELCDEQVEGSDGVFDPRFRINTVIDTKTTCEDTLKKIASLGRASRRWVDFKESVIIDKEGIQPSIFLNPANIKSFTWEKSFARKADGYRMSFYNEELDYEQDELLVKVDDSVDEEDLDYIEDLDASGITDPDQVYRYGKFAHAQLKLRPETYTAVLGINNLAFLRGDVVALTHDRVQGVTCFGQVLSVDGLVISIDNPFNISNDDLPLYATFNNPESLEQNVVTYEITDVTDNQVTFSSLPAFDLVESLYSIGTSVSSLTRLYMVKNIVSADDLEATVELVDYASPTIYEAANSIANYDSGTVDLTISQIAVPVAPEIIEIVTDESALKINTDGSIQIRALIVLSTAYKNTNRPSPKTVEIYYRPSGTNGAFRKVIKDIEEELYVNDLEESLAYDFKVRYVSAYSVNSNYSFENNVPVIGKTTLPPDVETIEYKDGKLSWDYPNPPLDLAGFRIRYSTGGVAVWEDAILLDSGTITTTSYDASSFVASVNSFLIKAIDTSGNLSANAARIVINLGTYDAGNIVTTINKFDDNWPDAIVNGYIDSGTGYLCNETTEFYVDDSDLFYNVNDNELFYSVNNVEMFYEFSFTPDVEDRGASMFIEIGSSIESAYLQWMPSDDSPFYTGDDDSLFYGSDSDYFYGLTTTDYVLFNGFVSSIKAAEYKFRVVVPANKQEGSCLRYVKIIVDVEDIDETIDDFVVSGGEARLPISENYRSIENVQVTLQDNSTDAVSVKIVDKNIINGPLIRVFDSTGALIEAAVDARIRGY